MARRLTVGKRRLEVQVSVRCGHEVVAKQCDQQDARQKVCVRHEANAYQHAAQLKAVRDKDKP